MSYVHIKSKTLAGNEIELEEILYFLVFVRILYVFSNEQVLIL